MNREKQQAIAIIGIFCIISTVIAVLVSQRLAEFGLWIMPALFHLYPIATILFAVIYSAVTSRNVLWSPLLVFMGIGLLLECLLFWLMELFIFGSPKMMALFILGQLILVYGVTWILYFSFASRLPINKA
ncbi:hypothetical protein JXL19_02925 [bacterium]|nr:hypothetical protein [bacterium]